MRALILTLCLTACTSEPAPLRLEGEDLRAEPARMICSFTGEEALVYTLSDGEQLSPIPTGRTCDYETFRAYVETYGEYPRAKPRMRPYREWLAEREA